MQLNKIEETSGIAGLFNLQRQLSNLKFPY